MIRCVGGTLQCSAVHYYVMEYSCVMKYFRFFCDLCVFVCLSVCPSVCVSSFLSVCLSFHLYFFFHSILIYLCLFLFFCLSFIRFLYSCGLLCFMRTILMHSYLSIYAFSFSIFLTFLSPPPDTVYNANDDMDKTILCNVRTISQNKKKWHP